MLFAYRWLKPIITTGLRRAIQENDIYAVKTDMRSDLNTEELTKLWELECQQKQEPSLFRILFKIYLCKVFFIGILFSIGVTAAR